MYIYMKEKEWDARIFLSSQLWIYYKILVKSYSYISSLLNIFNLNFWILYPDNKYFFFFKP